MDDKGHVMDINLDTIVHGTYWDKTAKQICGSDKEPYVADNQVNIYKSELKHICNPYISGRVWGMVSKEEKKHSHSDNHKSFTSCKGHKA